MGKTIEFPRYNVLSFRVSDIDNINIRKAAGDRPLADFLAAAVREKMINDKQNALDRVLRLIGSGGLVSRDILARDVTKSFQLENKDFRGE